MWLKSMVCVAEDIEECQFSSDEVGRPRTTDHIRWV